MDKHEIKIGTLVQGGEHSAEYIRQILPYGFESFSITFSPTLGSCDLQRLADECKDVLKNSNAVISSLGLFGNPLKDDEQSHQCRKGWSMLIDAAELFNCDIVAGFTGRLTDRPIDGSLQTGFSAARGKGRGQTNPVGV